MPLPPRPQTPPPPAYDAATGDFDLSSGEMVIEEEDLGWGDEGLLDDYAIDLGSMVVPQVWVKMGG